MTSHPRALVECGLGVVSVDLETGSLEINASTDAMIAKERPELRLPLLIASARCGSRIIAVVARRPPLVISDDVGSTWRETGAGLPQGRDVDISDYNPDDIVFVTESRVYVSENGGVFWRALDIELPQIASVSWETT